MRRALYLLIIFICNSLTTVAQTIENPVFDRTDTPSFRVNKVEITEDTTYLYCLYQAEANSWANLSRETFMEDIVTGKRLPLLKVTGLPYSPGKRYFSEADTIQVLLCFSHIDNKIINIIEDEDNKSFNIYGLDLNESFTSVYSYNDIVSFGNTAIAEYNKGNLNSAILYTLKQLEASRYVYGRSSFICSRIMYDLTLEYNKTNEFDKVLEWGNRAINILNTYPKDSMILETMARIYDNVGAAYISLKQFENAIDYEKKSLKLRATFDTNNIDYYWSLKNLYKSYFALFSIDDVKKYGEILVDYMEKHRDILGNEYLFYPIETATLAVIYNETKDYSKSYSYVTKTIGSVDLLLDYPSAYMDTYHKAIICLDKMGKKQLAFELCQKAIPYFDKNRGHQIGSNEYSDILLIFSNHFLDQGDLLTASINLENALNNAGNIDTFNYRTILNNLAIAYGKLGRLEESILLAEKSVNLCDSSKSIIEYADRLNTLAYCYSMANKPKKAMQYGKISYNTLKERLGIDNHDTMIAANNLGTYYNDLGYYEDSDKLYSLIIDHAGKNIIENGDILGSVYNNLAMYRPGKKIDMNESLDYITKSYNVRKEVLGEQDLYTIQSLYNRGRCLLELENISDGLSCINEALSKTKDKLGEESLYYIEMMRALPIICGKRGDYSQAVKIAEERYTLLKRIVDKEHISAIKAIEDLSELYFYMNDTIRMVNHIIDLSSRYKHKMLSNFSEFTSVERTNFVNEMGHFYDWLFPLVCYYKQNACLCSELYNALLLRKGILLKSEIEFSRLIRESGNSNLLSHYYRIIANKNLLNKQYQLPVKQRNYDLDSLKTIINEEEDYLVKESKEYGDYTKHFRTNWKDIRDKLKDDELSVEFVEFYDTCTIQNRIYYALVIDKYSDNPELVPICNEENILKAMKSAKSEELYQLIWNPILQKRKSVNTLFFSPAGILNNISIEYVNINEHDNISDKYAIYRLSSTREIVEKEESACKSAALYGGLDYSVDTDVLLAQNARYGLDAYSSVMYRGLSDSLSVRDSFEPLYNTKTEIAEIDKALKKGDVAVSMYSDTFGTEESFMALSGKGMNLIHLATHGMYIGASEAESKKKEINLSFIQLNDNGGGQIQEDKSLSRSFLVMSGGDMLPSHKEIPDNLEDGILTASEISKLDLRGLDLVVLSACQTALGDIDSEGVYGLQRGFKKAGANTILMSLDKVDDEATKILMVEFYKNLMNGKTKHQSLKDAQKYLRQFDNGKYDKPEYWASFIMLDGLN